MRAARVEHGGTEYAAVVTEEGIDLVPEPGVEPIDLIAEGGWDALRRAATQRVAAEEVRFLAPVGRPSKILGIGLNYKDHAEEQGAELPPVPVIFPILPSSVVGPDEPIPLHPESSRMDYEAELAVVIGRRCYRASRDEAMDVIAGYTALNDVSARDLQRSDRQWARAKGMDGMTPMGPVLVSPDELDGTATPIRSYVNGELRQNSNTSNLAVDIPGLIELCSGGITLEPGDVIATGTPGGVGFAMDPPRYLQDGDVVTVEIQGIGSLTNPVSAAAAQSSRAK